MTDLAKNLRPPSTAGRELRMLEVSLSSIRRDIETGIEQLGDHWDEPFARHVGERIANVETLLQQIRIQAMQAAIFGKRS